MMRVNTKLQILILMLGGFTLSGQVLGQARVVDAGSDRAAPNAQPQPVQPAATNGQNDIMLEMYLQLEALQNEIQNLRGIVEEQSYQIRRMQTEQRDRYLDTDARLTELFSYHSGQQPVANLNQPQATGNNNTTQPPVANETGLSIGQSGPGANPAGNNAQVQVVATPRNEQELYREALNLLLEAEAFQESVDMFQQYIDIYPQGVYFTNALYWQGAALHLQGNYTQSIAVLQRLLQEYPQDPKAPTAMLRLGTVYNEMGNTVRAAEFWRRVIDTYPGSTSEVQFAAEYLNDAGI